MSRLNPKQFPSPEALAQRQQDHDTKPGFYRQSHDNPYMRRREDYYEYQVPRADGGKERIHLDLQIQHTAPSAHYSYDAVEKHTLSTRTGLTSRQADHIAKRSWIPEAEKDALNAHAEGAPKLFGSAYTPGKSEVHSLFGTKRGAAHTSTILGIAAKDTAERYGRTLTPPDDLSPHSSKLVSNLKGKGVVDETAPTDVTNNYEHYSEPEYTTMNAEHRVPDAEVEAGRSTMRSVLRQGRPRKPRETYTQERLL